MTHADRATSFAWVGACYATSTAVGVGAAWLARRAIPGLPAFATVAVGDAAATASVFVWSWALDNSSMYDAYWSVAPMVYAPWLAYAAGSEGNSLRRAVVTSLVLTWGARLTWNWARGWTGLSHEDWRYVDLRNKMGAWYWPVSLLGLHAMPTAMVLLGSLPLEPALRSSNAPWSWKDTIATAITAGAITLEAVADQQLRAFRLKNKESGPIMQEGVWAHARHPNYLGEIGFWWGLSLFGLAAKPTERWRTVGAAAINALFAFISIPMIDKRSKERRPGYAEHMKNVPALLPRLRRLVGL